MKKRVTIIGAGVGGLATAARLASQGISVDVYEKLSRCGGRNNIRIDHGFSFDTGPSFVLMPDFFEEVFTACGERLKDHLNLVPLDISYNIFFSDGEKLAVYHDTEKTIEGMARFQNNARESFKGFIGQTARMYEAVKPLLYRCFRPAHCFSPGLWPLLARLKPFQTYWDIARRFFTSEKLCYVFTFEAMFIGVSPFRSPAFYSIISYADHIQKIFHPLGGMYQIPLALEKIAKKHGARFHYSSEVDAYTGNGIFRLKNGALTPEAEHAVINADYAYAQRSILRRRLPRYEYSCSVYLLYLGVKKKLPNLAHHNLFFSGDLRKNLHQIFNTSAVPEDPSFYIHMPTVTDASLAPTGKELVYILIPTANLRHKQDDIRAHERRLKKLVYEKISRVIGEDFEPLIEVEQQFAPFDFVDLYNIEYGATFGLSHTLPQSAFFRPPNFDSREKKIFYVGASTQPGGGLPVVIASSKIVADRILTLS